MLRILVALLIAFAVGFAPGVSSAKPKTRLDVTEVVLERSYHVATLDNDAPTIFEGSIEFVESVLAARGARPDGDPATA